MIHETAVVDKGAIVGVGTKIWHFCHVMPGARIGTGCTLGQNVFVSSQAVIGNFCKIQNNVSIYDGVMLQDEVFIGPSVVFTNVREPVAYERGQFEHTVVGSRASIGANATIRCGVVIGKGALIGAGAVVIDDVPPYAVVVGNPARVIRYKGDGCELSESCQSTVGAA